MNFQVLVFAFALLLSFNVVGQDQRPKDLPDNAILKCAYEPDSAILKYTQQLIKQMYSDGKNNRTLKTSGQINKIPVVVHVIEPSTASSLITDEQINGVIANLNAAYRGTGAYVGSPDTEIEFELAHYDPQCSATSGITRYDASGSSLYVSKGVFNTGVSWGQVQSWVTWDKNAYLNIWLVNKLDNGADGVGGPAEGLIAIAGSVKGSRDHVSPHEVGHYLGVAHPFPSPSQGCNCGDGDGLADTQNLMSYGIASNCAHEWGCSPSAMASINPCTAQAFGEIQHNIMNYLVSGCDQKFTIDQTNLMRSMLQTYHASLLSSPALSTSQPAPVATLVGPNTFCTGGDDFPAISPICVCSTVSGITRNGATISQGQLTSKPILGPGQSTVWNMALTCANGLTASKSVTFYNPGVTNVTSSCTSPTNYKINFDNPGNYTISASAGTISGNSVINIPNSTSVTITASDGIGCDNSLTVDIPCCAQKVATAPQCIPTVQNGLSIYYGIDNVTFGTINKSSSSSADDGANYIDRTCTNMATFTPGSSQQISVKGYYTNQHAVKVYIDFDNNGVFSTSNPNELVLTGTTPGGSNNVVTGNISFPLTATLNVPLRVRVLADPSSQSDACNIIGYNTGRTLVNFGSGQIEDFSVKLTSALPVTLVNFEGRSEENGILLKWSTTSEKNNKGFEIDRSEDAVHFTRAGFVDGKGETRNPSEYLYTDKNVNPGTTYYYRLKQIDLEGTFELSRMITVKSWYEESTAYISPNPIVEKGFTLSAPDANNYNVSMLTITDIPIPITSTKTNDNNELAITVPDKLPGGLYLLKIRHKNGKEAKVIKVIVR